MCVYNAYLEDSRVSHKEAIVARRHPVKGEHATRAPLLLLHLRFLDKTQPSFVPLMTNLSCADPCWESCSFLRCFVRFMDLQKTLGFLDKSSVLTYFKMKFYKPM